MYKRILLASDQSRESLVALREGALIARIFKAKAHLLIINRDTPGLRMAEGMAMQRIDLQGGELLELGLSRLRKLGVAATGQIARGDPTELISQCVRSMNADLVVLGHRRRTFLDRWWSGASGGYVIDGVPCSLLIARDSITDAELESHFEKADDMGGDQATS